MPDRFFLETPIAVGQTSAELTGDEAHHMAQVLRAKKGQSILVFDGSGHEWPAVITDVNKRVVQLQLGAARFEALASQTLTIGVALPKGDRQKWLIEKLVELNVQRFVPLIAERGVAQPVESALQRLRRHALEACKQCGRVYLLEITEPLSLVAAVALANEQREPAPRLNCLMQPINAPETDAMQKIATAEQRRLPWLNGVAEFQAAASRWCWIGPEGGWTQAEVEASLAAGCVMWDLGPRLLRVETAAITVAVAALLK